MRLLLFDDLMTSYTNARPELASSWWISTSARGIATVDGPTAVRRS
ncbi:MAG TPA: hypothetical protein VK724_24150 [Bryobacteraceae bacterium]|nr:hypothetical protein [Bryobacteraceae bacterium]